MRTTKITEDFYEILTVFELDGETPITGLSSSNFTIAVYKNGVSESLSPTVSEIGSGHYLITFTGGFSTKGYRMITSVCDANGILYRTDLQVTEKDIDDVYTAVVNSLSSSGTKTLNITVQDNNGAAVSGASINILNSADTAIVSFGNTDGNGLLSVSINPGTYIIKVHSPGNSFSPATTVVDNSNSQDVTITGTTVSVTAPSDPTLCRLFADFVNSSGVPVQNFKIVVTSSFSAGENSFAIVSGSTTHTSDVNGHIEFDAIRGATIEVVFLNSTINKIITVPDSAVANLITVMDISSSSSGSGAANPFQVVS